jgi:hypothetical protein
MPDDDSQYVGLAEAVEALRNEFMVARESGRDHPIGLHLGPVEVEFNTVVKRSGGGKFGLTFGVVTAGADATVAKEKSHRVKVTLTPYDATTGGSVDVTDGGRTIKSR